MSDTGASSPGSPVASEPPLAPALPTADDVDATEAGGDRPWSWHLMQASAWLLLVLLPLQVLTVFVLHDPGHFGVATYIDRWHHSGWRLFDWLVVVLAVVHGTIGLYGRLVEERVHRPFVRDAVALVGGVAMALLLLGFSVAVLSFDAT